MIWLAPLIGAALGGVLANQRNQEMRGREGRTRRAAADAMAVSWARKDGRGHIPEIEKFEGTDAGNMLQGIVGGGMQGLQGTSLFGKSGSFTPEQMKIIEAMTKGGIGSPSTSTGSSPSNLFGNLNLGGQSRGMWS